MSYTRKITLGALLSALSLAAPAAAGAVTISYDGSGNVTHQADPGETLDTNVGYGTDQFGEYVSFDDRGLTVTRVDSGANGASQQCDYDNEGVMRCTLLSPTASVHVIAGSGNDDVSVFTADISGFPANTGHAITIDGGDGNDTLLGGSADETLDGGPGADAVTGMGGSDVLDGGDGNDTLGGDSDDQRNDVSEGGDDVIHGGAGDDRLTGDGASQNAVIGHDVLDGGPGADTVYDDWYRFDANGGDEDSPPTVTLDGQANDGRPGENDSVVGVETIDTGYSGSVGGVYVGSAGPDAFHLLFADGSVSAGGGDDVVTGADGADAIDGGAGNDQLSGGFGPDTITGGPGQDDIGGDRTASCFYGPIYGSCTTGSGNDTINAVDGERDTIDCGPGADVANVDAIDAVSGCETVHVSGAPPSGSSPSPTPPGPTPPSKSALKSARIGRLHGQHLRKIARARAIVLSCRMAGAGRCSIRATISAKSARKLHLKTRHKAQTYTLGSGRRTFKHAGNGRVRVKLSRKTARRLRHAHKLRITFTATATYADGHRKTIKRATFKR